MNNQAISVAVIIFPKKLYMWMKKGGLSLSAKYRDVKMFFSQKSWLSENIGNSWWKRDIKLFSTHFLTTIYWYFTAKYLGERINRVLFWIEFSFFLKKWNMYDALVNSRNVINPFKIFWVLCIFLSSVLQ